MKMKTILSSLSFFAFVFFGVTAYAQQSDWCAMDRKLEERVAADPSFALQHQQGREAMRTMAAEQATNRGGGGVTIIPVVVHIIHFNGIGNITDEQVRSGIDVLNEDFRKMNEDTTFNRPEFVPHVADSEIEFRLATLDPNGACTNGIMRVNSTMAYNADDAAKSLSYWPSDRYFNVWLANSLDGGGGGGVLLGYAQFPWWGVDATYGIIMRNDRWGAFTGTSNSDGRTATHEIGHCLSLFHTFQSGCGNNCSSSGDDVCDTPPVTEASYSCSQSENTCSNDGSGPSPYGSDVVDQIENYMSYNSCQSMFTIEQKDRMQATLTGFPELVNLVSPANLIATGVDVPATLCRAEFDANYKVVCAGDSVQFTDMSFNNVVSRNWTFAGGDPAVSTDENPLVVYNTPGIYDVGLAVGDGLTTIDTIKSQYMMVLPTNGYQTPYVEGFENAGTLPNNDWVLNNVDGGTTWQLTTIASYSGDYSIRLFNVINGSGNLDEIYSNTIDLSDADSIALSFKVAYAPRTSSSNDFLKIYVSNDCGRSWSLRRNLGSSTMATVPAQLQPFTPSGQNEWMQVDVTNISTAYAVENFRFKFAFESGNGNNVYIDDINIEGLVGIEDSFKESINFAVYPNPLEEGSVVGFTLQNNANIVIDVLDITGRTVAELYRGNMQAGQHQQSLQNTLQGGIYFVRVQVDEQVATEKVIIR